MTYGGMFMRTFKRRSLLLLQKPLALCRTDGKGLVLLRQLSLALRSSAAIFIVAMVCAMGTAQAFTNVQVAAGSPPGLESAFLASTTAQFTATVVTNPFFSGTYNLLLQGFNPLFNPAPKMQDLLNAIVSASTQNYVYGFGGGMEYQNSISEGIVGGFSIRCSSPSAFQLNQTSTDTFDSKTCQDVLNTVENAFFQLNISTPTPLPVEP